MGGLFPNAPGQGPLYKAEIEERQMRSLLHKEQAAAAKIAADEAKLRYNKLKMEEDFLNSPEVQGVIQGGQMRMDLSPQEGTPGVQPPADLPTLMNILATAKARSGDTAGLAQLAESAQKITQRELINKFFNSPANLRPGAQAPGEQGVGQGPVMGLAPEQVAALKASGLDLTDVIRLFTPDYDKVQTFDEESGAYFWTFKDKKTGRFLKDKTGNDLMVPAKPAEFNRVQITNPENAPGSMLERKDRPGQFVSPWQQTGPAPLEKATEATPGGGEKTIWVNPYAKGGGTGPGVVSKLPPTDIPTPTDPESKKEVTDLVTTAKELRAMADETDPRFVGVWNQIAQIGRKKGAGLGISKTDPQFTEWQGTIENYKTLTRRSLFGTQVTKGEEAAFNKFWPDQWWNDVDGFKKGLHTVARAMELKAESRARGQMLSGTQLLKMAEQETKAKPALGMGGPPKTAEEFMDRLNKRGRK